ncbi:hypothetical protein IFM89_005978 [Coptis chinensis]|uniref:Uncharacterized protein n=1 Tax=Coptis chinensis TaxID=261450 RepID=A0A835LTY4_9MAGN|nr:hypothetical protein IFM89_005978 [Coptis chinensis]
MTNASSATSSSSMCGVTSTGSGLALLQMEVVEDLVQHQLQSSYICLNQVTPFISSSSFPIETQKPVKGTIAFTTSGRPDYGFGIFSVKLPSTLSGNLTEELTERHLTDGTSNNFNGQFIEENEGTITYISLKNTGSAQIFLT